MAAPAKERAMVRRSTRSESDSRLYAEQIMRKAQQLTHEAISLAHLIDRVPIGPSLGKRLGPKIRVIRDLVELARVELRAARLEHLAAQDPLAHDGSGAELATAIAEAKAEAERGWRECMEIRGWSPRKVED
jgi:hypothetical protein